MLRLPRPPMRRILSRPVRKRWLLLGTGLALLTAGAGLAPAAAGTSRPAGSPGLPGSPIKHVIEIMIENHSFDNLFGNFPGADGIPANTSMLNPNAYYDSAPNVSPVWATPNEGDVQGAINNSAVAEQMAMEATRWITTRCSRRTACRPSPSSARSSTRTSNTWPATTSWPTTTSSR